MITVNEEMKMQEVKAAAKEVGVTYKVGMTKKELVTMVNDKIDSDGEGLVSEEEVNTELENMGIDPEEKQEEQPAEDTEEESAPLIVEEDEQAETPAEEGEEEKPKLTKREKEDLVIQGYKFDDEVNAILENGQSKADRIRALLQLGIERKHVAKLMGIRYQMVYQVQQRMLAKERQEELKAQARQYKDIIGDMPRSKAKEEYSDELLAEVDKLFAEEVEEV